MNTTKLGIRLVIIVSQVLCSLLARTGYAADDSSNTTCTDLTLEDIPVGDFEKSPQMPESAVRVTQIYNNSIAEGFCFAEDKSQPPLSDPRCTGRKAFYGHNGVDFHQEGAQNGVNSIYSIQDGIVIASHSSIDPIVNGWGETIIVATRTNRYSEEILTTAYHHMYYDVLNEQTSRRFSACDQVWRGAEIGKEGQTGGDYPVHLHLTVRRWKNLAELKDAIGENGIQLYGVGYARNQTELLANHLDPLGILYNRYKDFEGRQDLAWALPYALEMRRQGVYFGMWDGGFGAIYGVTRREGARWLKIAAAQSALTTQTATFDDVPVTDDDFSYVETLARYPQNQTTINTAVSCKPGGKYFCPDNLMVRAEALKMVIMALYGDEYLKRYDFLWRLSPDPAILYLSQFIDVDPYSWYASYTFFGLEKGLLTVNDLFRPFTQVNRVEMAKWIIMGIQHKKAQDDSVCSKLICDKQQYCDDTLGKCVAIPTCVSNENVVCEVGGGYTGTTTPVCTPFSTRDCELCGFQQCAEDGSIWGECLNQGVCLPGTLNTAACNIVGAMQQSCQENSCTWGNWSSCSAPSPACTPSETQSQSCNSTGTQTRTCSSAGQWGEWSACSIAAPVCTPSATESQSCNSTGTRTRTCSSAGQWGEWSACSMPPTQPCVCTSGVCCDGCNYRPLSEVCESKLTYRCEGSAKGQDSQQATVWRYCSGDSSGCTGSTNQSGWTRKDDCSSVQVCEMNSGIPECVGACTDTWTLSSTNSCYSNPGGSTLCLEAEKASVTTINYRVCKSGGNFLADFNYQLKDENNGVFFPKYFGSIGTTCTSWQTASVDYVSEYGVSNGAGLTAMVIAPAGCTQSVCEYRTGAITVTKTCE